ncbi:glycoside hydrolase family 13 protein [Romboutsia sp.]|uniref:glycoside hydrolase family 13 protein n=1 Tax=Romboutsia sp. TaxID=1965302 RepID=UPI003F363592
MGNILSYNSWEDKAPFGALKVNQEGRITIKISHDNVLSVALIILNEEEIIDKINLAKNENEYYECKLNGFKEKGLYFYYFEVDIECNGSTEKRFYGKSYENGQAVEYLYENINKYQITVHEEFEVANWYKEGIMYHIFVDRFNNGNRNKKPSDTKENSFIYANWSDTPMYIKDKDNNVVRWDFYGGNLKGIIDKIGYLKKMGVSIIYLSPIFESSSNHKYDTADYKKIDSMFGDEAIFSELIEKANQKGISIILDGVFSHTGADSRYFNKFGNYDEIGAYQSTNSKYSTWYNFENFPDKYKCWWGVDALPNTNELAPSYMDYIIRDEDSVIKKWTNLGVKGWRLDVADELPTEFIKTINKELKTVDKEAILIGEVWEDASNKISYGERRSYLLGNQLDSIMGYPFRENIVAFLKGDITSKQLNNKFMETKENYPKESFKANLNLIGSHDVARIKTVLDNDIDKVKLAVAIQATFEGIPYIYYGDEAGICGGVDPDNRRTYPWKNEDEDMVEFYKEAMGNRRKNRVLIDGETTFIDTKNNDVFGYIRYNEANEKIIILINRSEKSQNVYLDIEESSFEELDIKNSTKRYLERFDKEGQILDIEIDSKSCKIFTVIKNTSE